VLVCFWCSMLLFCALVILTFAFIFAYYYYIAVRGKVIYKHSYLFWNLRYFILRKKLKNHRPRHLLLFVETPEFLIP